MSAVKIVESAEENHFPKLRWRAKGKTFRSRVLSIGIECTPRRKIFLLSRPGGADKFSRKEKLVNKCAILDEKGLC